MPAPANEALFDATVRHQIKVLRLTQGEAKRADAVLAESEAEIVAKLKQGLTDATRARLEAMLADLRQLRAAAFAKVSEQLRATLDEVSKAEADWEEEAIRSSCPVQLDLTSPTPSALKAVAGSPINGVPLDDWIGDLTQKDARRIEQQVRLGFTQGETVDQIVARIRGTKANGYADGVASLSRRNAQAIARTAVNHVSNEARQEVWNANRDIIKGVRWTATLDGRTSDVCRGRDGMVYPVDDGPRPPAHVGCRSTTVAVLNGPAIVGERPAVTDVRTRRQREVDFRQEAKIASGEKWADMTAAERAEAIRLQRESWTATNVGTVPTDVTYDSWLRKQPKEFQDEVLGAGKAAVFRDGLTLDKFVDDAGKPYTLAQLKAEIQGDKLYVVQPGVGLKAKALLQSGLSNQEVLDSILKEFPDAKTSLASISSYKVELKKAGVLDELVGKVPTSALKQGQSALDAVVHLDASLPEGLKQAVGGQWATVVPALEGSPGAYGYYKAGQGVMVSAEKLASIPATQAKQVLAHELGHMLNKQFGIALSDESLASLKVSMKSLSPDAQKLYSYYLSHVDEAMAEILAQAISPSPITSQGLSATEFNQVFGQYVDEARAALKAKFPSIAKGAVPLPAGGPTAPYEVVGKHPSASSLAKAMLQQGVPEEKIAAAIKAEFPAVTKPEATIASAKSALKKGGTLVSSVPGVQPAKAILPGSAESKAAVDAGWKSYQELNGLTPTKAPQSQLKKVLTPEQKAVYDQIRDIIKSLKEPASYAESGKESLLPPWAYDALKSGGQGPLWKLKNMMPAADAEELFAKMFAEVKANTPYPVMGGWDALWKTSGLDLAKLEAIESPALEVPVGLKPGPTVVATKAAVPELAPAAAAVSPDISVTFPELTAKYPSNAVLSGYKLKELGVEMFEQGILDNKTVADLLEKLYPNSKVNIKVANVASWKTNWKKQYPERFAAAEKKVDEAKKLLAQVAKQSQATLAIPKLYGQSLGPYSKQALQDVKLAIQAGEKDQAKLLKVIEKAFAPKGQAFDPKAGGDILELAKYELSIGKAAAKPYLAGAYSAPKAPPVAGVDLTPTRPAATPLDGLPPPPRFTDAQRRAAIQALARKFDTTALARMNAVQVAQGLPALTAEEAAAIRLYTGGIYRKLNRDLRGGAFASKYDLQAYVEAAQHGLAKMPKYVGDVSRGMSLSGADLERALATYQPGAVIEEHAFISTSKGERAAFGGNVFVRIKSKTGVDVSSYSYYPREREVLFKPGTRLRVRKVEKRGSLHIVYMEEL